MSISFSSYATHLALVSGALTWTLIEYVFHRWLGHDARFRPNFFSNEHTRHHSEGNYFSPPWKKVVMAVVVLTALGVPAYLTAEWIGLIFISGIVFAYLAYELTHSLYHVHPGLTWYGKRMRRHHFHHHFANPKMNHGVTSPIWDVVFRTYEPAREQLRVPAKLQMRWLADPETGEVRPEHAQRYSIIARRGGRS